MTLKQPHQPVRILPGPFTRVCLSTYFLKGHSPATPVCDPFRWVLLVRDNPPLHPCGGYPCGVPTPPCGQQKACGTCSVNKGGGQALASRGMSLSRSPGSICPTWTPPAA